MRFEVNISLNMHIGILTILCSLEIDPTLLQAHISCEMCCTSTWCHNPEGLSMNQDTSDLILTSNFNCIFS
jgi:hypothetical protein